MTAAEKFAMMSDLDRNLTALLGLARTNMEYALGEAQARELERMCLAWRRARTPQVGTCVWFHPPGLAHPLRLYVAEKTEHTVSLREKGGFDLLVTLDRLEPHPGYGYQLAEGVPPRGTHFFTWAQSVPA